MADVHAATALAEEMVWLGEGAGRRTVGLVTAMDNPFGESIGNALEVTEALSVLSGRGDEELVEVSLKVAGEMCRLAGVKKDPAEALRSGAGRQKFEQMLKAQGGRLEEGLPEAPHTLAVEATADGFVESIDALEIGLTALELGAGRERKEDKVDHSAGFVIHMKVGDRVRAGERLVSVHARTRELAEKVVPRLRAAWKLSRHEVERPPHVLARVDKDGITKAR
jgi:thymidine phosphorylase